MSIDVPSQSRAPRGAAAAAAAKSSLSREAWGEAALEALAAGGLEAVAVEPLARRLGVTKGSFYWHFPSREALLREALALWEKATALAASAAALSLEPQSVAFDLAMPWASGHLVDAVVEKPRGDPSAWSALWMFVGVYFAFAVVRNISHRFWIPLAARNMEEMTNEGFARVQAFSSDWHADSFAGATVRKLTRAMWGYDSVTDAVTIWLGPGIIVLVGLSFMMLFRQPLAGVVSLVVVAAYLGANLIVTERYVRPSNLRSNALDSKIGGALADAVTSNPTVKSFGAEARETARIAAVTAEWREAVMITWNRFTDVWLGQNLLLVLLQAGLTGSMVWAWSQGRATPGDVAFAISSSHGWYCSFACSPGGDIGE